MFKNQNVLLDSALDTLEVKESVINAVNNEVKELLWILEREYNSDVNIKTVNITKKENQTFEFKLEDESNAQVEFSSPLNYLYEPNASILKAGAFNTVSGKLGVYKLHKHSHLDQHLLQTKVLQLWLPALGMNKNL